MTDKANKMRRSRREPAAGASPVPDMSSAFADRSEATRKLTVIVSEDRYDKLRRIAYEQKTSITKIITAAIDGLPD